jgi:hypothetical protein
MLGRFDDFPWGGDGRRRRPGGPGHAGAALDRDAPSRGVNRLAGVPPAAVRGIDDRLEQDGARWHGGDVPLGRDERGHGERASLMDVVEAMGEWRHADRRRVVVMPAGGGSRRRAAGEARDEAAVGLSAAAGSGGGGESPGGMDPVVGRHGWHIRHAWT